MNNPNTIAFSCSHIPFVKRGFLDFLVDTAREHKCKRACHAGDIVDHHAISFHAHDPDGRSAGDETGIAKKELKRWYKAFPELYCAIGNHDALAARQAMANGLSSRFLKSFAEVYETPPGWRFKFEWRFGNWRLTHGTGTSGHDAAFKSAIKARISTAQGHIHAAAGVKFHASNEDIIWGLQCGCGLDRKTYAAAYGRDFLDKPILGCGVVLENGTLPMFIPMPL